MTLQEWMDLKGWKDADLAARLPGLSRSQVSRIRRRKSIPPPETAKRLEEVTGIPAERLAFEERAA